MLDSSGFAEYRDICCHLHILQQAIPFSYNQISYALHNNHYSKATQSYQKEKYHDIMKTLSEYSQLVKFIARKCTKCSNLPFGWNILDTNLTVGGLFGYSSVNDIVSLNVPSSKGVSCGLTTQCMLFYSNVRQWLSWHYALIIDFIVFLFYYWMVCMTFICTCSGCRVLKPSIGSSGSDKNMTSLTWCVTNAVCDTVHNQNAFVQISVGVPEGTLDGNITAGESRRSLHCGWWQAGHCPDKSRCVGRLRHSWPRGQLQHLQSEFGVTDTPISWLHSYLETSRTQFVKLGQHQSPTVRLNVDVPQGSILGPLCSQSTAVR